VGLPSPGSNKENCGAGGGGKPQAGRSDFGRRRENGLQERKGGQRGGNERSPWAPGPAEIWKETEYEGGKGSGGTPQRGRRKTKGGDWPARTKAPGVASRERRAWRRAKRKAGSRGREGPFAGQTSKEKKKRTYLQVKGGGEVGMIRGGGGGRAWAFLLSVPEKALRDDRRCLFQGRN